MCMWVFGGSRINFDRITAFRTLVILGNFLHCRVWSMCNQLLLQFSMVVVVALLFYVHGKQLRSCRDGQLT